MIVDVPNPVAVPTTEMHGWFDVVLQQVCGHRNIGHVRQRVTVVRNLDRVGDVVQDMRLFEQFAPAHAGRQFKFTRQGKVL